MLDEVQAVLAETHGAVLDLQGEFREFVRAFRAAAGQADKRVAAGFEGRRFEATRLCLRVGGRNVCLLARREVRLGKNRDNDVVVRILPPSPANDVLTDRISRHHALLQFTRDEVVWRNLGCANGTVAAGQPLPAGASRALHQGATVSPAGVLPLSCTLCFDEPPAGAAVYGRFEQRLGFPGAPPAPQRVQAVRLRRQDGLAGREEYVIFPRGVFVGSDPACPVRVEDPSAAPLHAQILWLGGSFWLEPLQASRATLAEGRPVAPDHLVPVYPGLTLTLGVTEVTVAPYQQMHVDF
jgi:pSer/pThr/pTyr-binding forkhead associated (FHA) protein